MPATYISNGQRAKNRQEMVYTTIRAKCAEQGFNYSVLADLLGESRQKFTYRYKNRKLEAWELIAIFTKLQLTIDDIGKLMRCSA